MTFDATIYRITHYIGVCVSFRDSLTLNLNFSTESREMAILDLNYRAITYQVLGFLILLQLMLPITAKDIEGEHGVLKQGGRCVHTVLIPHSRGEDCRELCSTFQQLCQSENVVNELILQLHSKIHHCGNGKERPAIFRQGDSCTYVFSVPAPQESDECPPLCSALSDICIADDTVSELREWIQSLNGANERLKSMVLQLLSRADELEVQKHSLESERSDLIKQLSTMEQVQARNRLLESRETERVREFGRLQTTSERHHSEVKRLRNTVELVTSKVIEFENDVNICMGELNDTKKTLLREFEANEEFRANRSHLHDQMTETRKRQRELQSANDRLMSQLENKSSLIDDLRRENYELKQLYRSAGPTTETIATERISHSGKDCIEDCSVVQRTGLYTVDPDNDGKPFQVYCDVETDSAGWTVIQRRQDGSVDFYRGWEDYKNGFGDLNGEFWLGNDKIHRLTNQGQRYELRVDLENFENETRFAQYDDFTIANERRRYEITLGSYSGNAGDSMKFDNGKQFTTKDNDNDRSAKHNCAVSFTGAWWYSSCSLSNLNGQYLDGENNEWGRGIVWYDWLGMKYSLKKTDIKIRPSVKDD
ncbi:fibrinogen C domain-containing protein 1-A-like [Ptychodera flava]|uniref:fibrinogen C domain-containing protein 1-A-like n=1 Tax=Ptychodera flava TaxID=63121 RepID=UPI003969E0D1